MKSATCTGLFFIIVALTAILTEGWIIGKAERCFCLNKAQKMVRPASVQTFQIIPPSASCSKTEIILTLMQGMKVCLDPKGNQGQKILTGQKQKKISKGQKTSKGQQDKKQKNMVQN